MTDATADGAAAPFLISLEEARARLRGAASALATPTQHPASGTRRAPDELSADVLGLIDLALRLGSAPERIHPRDVTELGDAALGALHDLATWAMERQQPTARTALQAVTLAVTDWIMQHTGELRTLEPVVDALAATANRRRDAPTLEQLTAYASRVIGATSEAIRRDPDPTDPARPWRLLHLNRGIMATRSHDTALMERVYDELVVALPHEAARFFAEAMQQMDALNYPPAVRAVVARYHERWTRGTLH
jgi:hypothetical protein